MAFKSRRDAEKSSSEIVPKTPQSFLRTIAENYPNSYVLIIEKDLTIGFCAGQEFKKQNLNPGDFIGLHIDEIFGSQTPLVKKNYQATFRGEEKIFELFINNQHQLYKTVPLFTEQKQINQILVVVENITDRKNIEKQLQKEKQNLQQYLDIAGVMFVVLDVKGHVTLINKKGCHILGFKEEEILGKNWFETFIPPRSRKKVRGIFRKIMKNEMKGSEYAENVILTRTGEKIMAWHNTIIRDQEGKITGSLSSGEDITERKKAKKEKVWLEQQLRQAQKMEAIGTLAGGIAHDFNNMLGVIIGNAELSLELARTNESLKENLREILTAADRTKEMTRQILTFSRKQRETQKAVNLDKIVKEEVKLLRSTIPTTIDIRSRVQENLSHVIANSTQIHQVIMNISTNAAYAMRKNGGILDISLKEVRLNPRKARLMSLEPGLFQKLTIKDTGHGMSSEILARIFEPYFTTKKEGEGTGMGLAVVHGIVKTHGGEIIVESDPAKGTAFHIYLPALVNKGREETNTAKKNPVLYGQEHILVVDDEPQVMEITKQMLSKLGYKVTGFTKGAEAIQYYQKHSAQIKLLITDMTMPKMTGLELTHRIHKIKANLPVILCTGFSEQVNEHNYLSQGISTFIMKPFNTNTIATTIRTVLDK